MGLLPLLNLHPSCSKLLDVINLNRLISGIAALKNSDRWLMNATLGILKKRTLSLKRQASYRKNRFLIYGSKLGWLIASLVSNPKLKLTT
jgi:hypothetical protein